MPKGLPQQRDAGRHGPPAHPARNVAEGWVTAKQFIAAEPRYRGLEAKLTRGFADEPGVDAIDRGLIHRLENSWQILPEFLLGDDADCVFAVVMGGALRREGSLVFRLVPIFLVRERDGIDPLLAGTTH